MPNMQHTARTTGASSHVSDADSPRVALLCVSVSLARNCTTEHRDHTDMPGDHDRALHLGFSNPDGYVGRSPSPGSSGGSTEYLQWSDARDDSSTNVEMGSEIAEKTKQNR